MLKKSFLSLSILLILTGAAFGQKVYTPEKDSAERKAILNALRVSVEKELKQKISFKVDKFNVAGAWAFLSGEPLNAKGDGKPNYRRTIYQRAIDEDMFDNNFFAVLKKSGKQWTVVTYAIGCTDVCYSTWADDYKAPKAIFSLPE